MKHVSLALELLMRNKLEDTIKLSEQLRLITKRREEDEKLRKRPYPNKGKRRSLFLPFLVYHDNWHPE